MKASKDTHYTKQRTYLPSVAAAAQINISDLTLLKLTDCVLYAEGQRKEFVDNKFHKKNIALQMKSKKNVSLLSVRNMSSFKN